MLSNELMARIAKKLDGIEFSHDIIADTDLLNYFVNNNLVVAYGNEEVGLYFSGLFNTNINTQINGTEYYFNKDITLISDYNYISIKDNILERNIQPGLLYISEQFYYPDIRLNNKLSLIKDESYGCFKASFTRYPFKILKNGEKYCNAILFSTDLLKN